MAIPADIEQDEVILKVILLGKLGRKLSTSDGVPVEGDINGAGSNAWACCKTNSINSIV